MNLPDITDMEGIPCSTIGGPLHRPCIWVVEEVYRRMGFDVSVMDQEQWEMVPLNKVPAGATLGFDGREPGFVEHFAIYLGWGLCLHATESEVAITPISKMVHRIVEAYQPCSLS